MANKEQAQQERQRIITQISNDDLLIELIKRGFGEIHIKIQDSKFILIEYNFKTKPQN